MTTTKKNAPSAAATGIGAMIESQVKTTTYSCKNQPISWEFWPTVWETMQAEKIFLAGLEQHSTGNSKEMAVKLAIIDVWKQARIFEAKRRRAV